MTRRTTVIASCTGALAAGALGGAALAGASGVFDDEQSQIAGPQADRAIAAALGITGGGTASSVELDSEVSRRTRWR